MRAEFIIFKNQILDICKEQMFRFTYRTFRLFLKSLSSKTILSKFRRILHAFLVAVAISQLRIQDATIPQLSVFQDSRTEPTVNLDSLNNHMPSSKREKATRLHLRWVFISMNIQGQVHLLFHCTIKWDSVQHLNRINESMHKNLTFVETEFHSIKRKRDEIALLEYTVNS